MRGERRNAIVVAVLVLSLTAGAGLLLALERALVPRRPNWEGSVLLMAELGRRVDSVEVGYVRDLAALDSSAQTLDDVDLAALYPGASVGLIGARETRWQGNGSQVHLIVVGSAGNKLPDRQKKMLLGALGSLSQASGIAAVRVLPGSALRSDGAGDLPPQADDLRQFLARKGFLAE